VSIRHSIPLLILLLSSSAFSYGPKPQKKYWVFFTDKGPAAKRSENQLEAAQRISQRALSRRAKHFRSASLIGDYDFRLHRPYIDEVVLRDARLLQQSRWLNAASFLLNEEAAREIASLTFVAAVHPVAGFRFIEERRKIRTPLEILGVDSLEYGPSFNQANLIEAVYVNQLGINGEGVVVGMLDTGFRWRIHEALMNSRVIGERDFIQNDDTTANQTGDPLSQDHHGTLTMSILGGYKPGKLIGPAHGVEFLLGKTEDVSREVRVEEDNWVAGLEWMESLGVDVVSSSLGYDIFQDGTGYRWENGDFDGRTAVTTRAAAVASRLGVLICTAMGNEGNGDGVRGTLLTPADADSVLSVGAVTFARTVATFTSTGPTNDARTKPEVVAPGQSIYVAIPGESTYTTNSGTSTATPLVAASAALVLSARPELTAMQVRDALMYTADTVATGDVRFSQFPNNFSGWGLINVRRAISYPTLGYMNGRTRVSSFIGSQHGVIQDSVRLRFAAGDSPVSSITMIRRSGPSDRSIGVYTADSVVAPLGEVVRFSIHAVDSTGMSFTIPEDTTRPFVFIMGRQNVFPPGYELPASFFLFPNYPNPFNSSTTIRVDISKVDDGTLTIFNVLGQEVKSVYSGTFLPGQTVFRWDGTNNRGIAMPSGMYLYSVKTRSHFETKKMMLLR
jgi:serine protease AprX